MSPRDLTALSEAPSAVAVNPVATPSMCLYCFDVLLKEKRGTGSSAWNRPHTDVIPKFLEEMPDTSVECPLFVTWEKRRGDRYELRGCIGTLSPRLLREALAEYALTSALRDRRFHPIALSEVPLLRVGVSLLVQYEECEHCYDWVVGVHGIIIKWRDSASGVAYSATYLPEVAKDQKWDQTQAVESLVQKSGYRGPATPELLQQITCTRYQSSKSRITVEEYVKHLGLDPSILVDDGNAIASSEKGSGNCVIM